MRCERTLSVNFRKPTDAFGILKNQNMADVLITDADHSEPGCACVGDTPDRLHEKQNFGTNPGQLRMFSYMPTATTGQLALIVVLHGCGQSAASYDYGAGWSTMADRYGFALLMPQQQRSNNPNGCFNWFQPEDAQRAAAKPPRSTR